jgi:hypothetical protein
MASGGSGVSVTSSIAMEGGTPQTSSDPTAEFFDRLAARGHEPMLALGTGSIRFDLVAGKRTERWLLTIDRGDVSVSRRNARAMCVVRTEKKLFDGIVRGEVNALAALLRGALTTEGDPELLMRFQRIFPGPDDARSAR